MADNSGEFDADAFLQAETQRNADAIEFGAQMLAANETVLQELELHNVSHIWHPSEAEQDRRRRSAAGQLLSEGLSYDVALATIARQALSELMAVTRIHLLQATEAYASETDMEQQKKQFLALLHVYEFGPEWREAASSLLGGVQLDTDNDSDRLIIEQEFQKRLEDENGGYAVDIKRILGAGSGTALSEPRKEAEILATTITIGLKFAAAMHGVQYQAGAEGFLYELLGEGEITPSQLTELQGVLRNIIEQPL